MNVYKHTSWEDDVDDEEEDDFKNNALAFVEYEPKRVILLLEVDCFEVQLWMQNLRPDLIGKDVPVVVISPDGIILSVNYTAKSLGVKRGKGRQALEDARSSAGSELVEITAGERYGKVDAFLPITESNWILDSLYNWVEMRNQNREAPIPVTIERTCRDEFYIDVTGLIDEKIESCEIAIGDPIFIPSQREINELSEPKNHPHLPHHNTPTTTMEGRHGKITGKEFSFRIQEVYPYHVEAYHQDELRLVNGAVIAKSILQHIEDQTKYQVSAGVGHSKLVAKLACGLNKPKGICIVTDMAHSRLSKKIPFQHLPGFGGKIGDAVQNWLSSEKGKHVEHISDILRATTGKINLFHVFQHLGFSDYEARALDLYNKCQFKDESCVTSKVHPDTISTAQSFKGCQQMDEFHERLRNIATDMKSRINYYHKRLGRTARELVIKVDLANDLNFPPLCQNICGKGVSSPVHRNLYSMSKVFSLHVNKNFHSVSPKFVLALVTGYIEENELCWSEIMKIHLTAKHFKTARTDND